MNAKPRSTARHARAAAPRLRPLALACACAALGFTPALNAAGPALPATPNVVSGQATFATQGNQLTVTNSNNAVINWQSFSIGAGGAVRFEQPHSSSQVLNRVLGQDPSQIFGRLSSNGHVWLLNPYGVVFGPNARIDVAGLVASTLAISDADWLAQRYRLTGGAFGAGSLVNQGELRTTAGGRLMLIGGSAGVRNEGLLDAPGGQVVLAAGASVDLADTTSPQVAVRVTAPQGQVLNLGRLKAPGGRIDLQAAMVNQQGIVRADSLSGGPGGEIVLRAADSAELTATSRTTADGAQGGRVTIEAPSLMAGGTVSASGSSGSGGRIQFTGTQIGLLDGSRTDASGSAGGGQITVGGGAMGQDPSLPNARALYMGPSAAIHADATARGDGGSIVLWSNQATRAYGTLSARGGPAGGNGGFIETSGGWLDARPASVRTDAPQGRAGNWLLDPNNILITDSGSNVSVTSGPNFTSTDDSAVILTATLKAALDNGGNVTITSGSGGLNAQPGDIRFQNASLLVGSSGQPMSLTVNAARNIDIQNSSLLSPNARLDLTLNAAGSGVGTILVQNSGIVSQGGTISLGGNALACAVGICAPLRGAVGYEAATRGRAISLVNATIDAGPTGTVRMRGASATESDSAFGVRIAGASSVVGRDIDIAGWAGSSGSTDQFGVKLAGGTISASRSLAITGISALSASSAEGGNELVGVGTDLGSSLAVTPAPGDPQAFLRINARSDKRSGNFDESAALRGAWSVSNGAPVDIVSDGGIARIEGTFNTGAASRLSFSGSSAIEFFTTSTVPSGAPLSITNQGGVNFADQSLVGNPGSVLVDTAGNVTIGGSGYGVTMNFGSAPMTVRGAAFNVGTSAGVQLMVGKLDVTAPKVQIGSGALVTASGAGDAMVFTGPGANITTFLASAPGALLAPNGRWLVYATDPTDSLNFDAGSLSYSFKQYAARLGTTPAHPGNGLLFSVAPVLTVSGGLGGNFTKVYDGTSVAAATFSGGSLGGLLPGDTVQGVPEFGPARYSTINAGTEIPIIVLLNGPLPAILDSQSKPVYGYTLSGLGLSQLGTILPRPLTLTGVTAADKVYDGTRTATLTGGTFGNIVPGEQLTLAVGSANFDTKDVGTGKSVTGTFTLADGANGRAGNYTLAGGAQQVNTTASITPRPLTLASLSVTDKVYDGTPAAQISGGVLNGLVAGESLNLGLSGAQFDTAHAGTGKPVTVQVALTDGANGQASNYRLGSNNAFATTGTILPRPLTFAGFRADDKVYDGSRTATLSGGTLSGLLGSETLTFTASGLFDTKDAGNGKAVVATLALGNGANGGLAANYVLNANAASTTANITPRDVTLTGITAASRPYDGTRNAELSGSGTLAGVVGNETLAITIGSGLFDTKDAGTGKTITASVSLADGSNGGLAANYRLTNGQSLTFTGTVTPRPLALSSLRAADKVYDGSTAAEVQTGTLQGLVPGETLQASFSGRFDTKDAGTGKTVTALATLADGSGGGLAANYALAGATATTTASITPRPVTVSGVFAQDKPYDGTTAATLAGSTFSGIVAGETLSLSGQAQFDSKTVGAGKRVTGTIALGDGSGLAANYSLTNPGTFTGAAAITPRGLTVTAATATGKVYDATAATQAAGFQLGGVIPGDQVVVTAGTGAFADANVGTAKPVTATATALGGADAANYVLARPSVQTTASIGAAGLTYVANPTLAARGAPLPAITGSVAGFLGGDNLANATSGTLLFTTTAVQGSPEGTYPVTGGGLTARNYTFAQSPGNATALRVVAMSTSTVGSSTPVFPTPTDLLTTLLPPPLITTPQDSRVLDVTPSLTFGSSPGGVGGAAGVSGGPAGGGPGSGGIRISGAPGSGQGDPGGTGTTGAAEATFGTHLGSGAGSAFRVLDVELMSQDDLAMALAARERYKKGVFADALAQLERDPTLADLPSCQTVEQAATGDCLITEALKPPLRERLLREEAAAPPRPAAAPAQVAAAPAPLPAPAAAPTPSPAPAVAPAVPAPAAPPAVAVARPAPPAPAVEAQIRLPVPRPVVSASLPQIRRKFALVIGTDDYQDKKIPRLDNAVGDAVAVGQVFERSLGYQTIVVRNGSRSAIVKAFNQLAATVSPQDSVVVYYAGHGELVEKTGLGYWQPADADSQQPQTWLSNTDIGKLLGLFGASQVALVSDSCFSGSLVSEERIRGTPNLPDPNAVLSRKAAVVMSSGGNEPVFDAGKNGHSPFAWNLMRTLEKVSAWRPGGNVFETVRFAVARELPQRPQYGASRAGGHQSGSDYLFEQRQLEAQAK